MIIKYSLVYHLFQLRRMKRRMRSAFIFFPPTLFEFSYRIFYIFLAKLLLIHRRVPLLLFFTFCLYPLLFFPRNQSVQHDERSESEN